MPFDFAAAKLLVRTKVHQTLAVQAFYLDDSMSVEVEIKARLHSKVSKPLGNLFDGAGYGDVIDGVDRIVFQSPTLDILGVPFTPVRNAVVRFPTLVEGLSLSLDMRDPPTGPAEEIWTVTRL